MRKVCEIVGGTTIGGTAFIRCSCGWQSEACPNRLEAEESWAEHAGVDAEPIGRVQLRIQRKERERDLAY